MNALDCLFLCAVHNKQGGYECYHIPTHQVITQHNVTVVPATPTIIVTINAIGKSDSIQNLKIANLCGHLLFDSFLDLALLPGVDEYNDDDNKANTSLAGVHDEDTSITGVPIPATALTNTNNESDAEPNHGSIDPNEANDNSAKHPYTALETTYLFTVSLVNHHTLP